MQNPPKTWQLTINLDNDSAEALLQLLKRLDFADCRAHAVSDEEAYRMQFASHAVQVALVDASVKAC